MPRTRMIDPAAPLDEDVAGMSLAARYLWAFLPCHADREGRLRDSAFTLKAAVFPADDVDVEQLLIELSTRRHIIRYEVDGRRFIQIRSFHKHQNPHTRERASQIPPVPRPRREEPGKGDASARPFAHAMSPSPGDPDPDPDPVPDPDPGTSRVVPRHDSAAPAPAGWAAAWTAEEWRKAFARAWAVKYRTDMGGGDAVGKATDRLDATIGDLTPDARLAAQARATAMFAEFLGDDGPELRRARHAWAWFVARFESLRVPAGLAGQAAKVKAQREIDSEVARTARALERSRVDVSKLPTRDELDQLRKQTRDTVEALAEAKASGGGE